MELSNQLSSLYPSLTKQYDENGNAILDLSGDVNTIVGSLDDLIERQRALANQEIVEQMPDLFKGYSNNVKEYEDEVNNAEKTRDEIQRAYETLNNWDGSTVWWANSGQVTKGADNAVRSISDYTNALDVLGIKYKQVAVDLDNDPYHNNDGYSIEADYNEFGTDLKDIYVDKFNKARDDVKYAKQQLDAERLSINQYLNTWLQTEFSYNQIEDNGIQKAIQEMLFNFDWKSLPEDIDRNDWEAVSEYLRRNILFAINNAQDDPVISKALSEVFTNTELTPNEKANYLQQIQDFFGEDSAITVSLKPQFKDTETLQNQYDDAINKFDEDEQQTLEKFFKDNSINTSSEIDYWNSVTKGANNAEEAIEMYNKAKENNDKSDISFLDTLNSSDFADTKEKLLDLAKSGEITSDVLESTEDYKTLLDKTGVSAEEAKLKILGMLTATEKLSAASKGMDSLSTAFEEWQDKGFVTASALDALPDVFKELDGYDLFSQIVGNPDSSKQEISQAFDDIATEYLKSQGTLEKITDENTSAYIANLKEMGIANAEEVVNEYSQSKNSFKVLLNEASNEWEEIRGIVCPVPSVPAELLWMCVF